MFVNVQECCCFCHFLTSATVRFFIDFCCKRLQVALGVHHKNCEWCASSTAMHQQLSNAKTHIHVHTYIRLKNKYMHTFQQKKSTGNF